MHAFETTARTGSDGVLRLEVDTGQPNQSMKIVITPRTNDAAAKQPIPSEAIIKPPVRWNEREPRTIRLGAPPVSHTLVEDRR